MSREIWKQNKTHRCFIDAESIQSHPRKEFAIMAPPVEKSSVRLYQWTWKGHRQTRAKVYSLEDGPVGWAFTMETSLLMPCEDVPDNDGLRIILSVHQRAESDQVSARERGHLAQHFLWYESHIASTHYCGSQTQVLRPLPKCREPAFPPYTMIPKNGIWSLQVRGGASTTRHKVITDHWNQTPQQVCLSGLV